MYQTISEAMQLLGDSGSIFGLESSRKGERKFKFALGSKLRQMTGPDGWTWNFEKEERFETEALANERYIDIDIVGRHPAGGMVAIELKYVPTTENGKPSNPPGFPWDVAKDCLRLDLLRFGYCRQANPLLRLPALDNLQTYAIAMTNWCEFWGRYGELGGWAKNFSKKLPGKPVRFDGLIETAGSDFEKTIYKQGRCHVALGLSWVGDWKPYSSISPADKFQYLFLRPGIIAKHNWTHDQSLTTDEQSRVIPFLNDDARNEWRRRKASYDGTEI
jgi:hypothetical protein